MATRDFPGRSWPPTPFTPSGSAHASLPYRSIIHCRHLFMQTFFADWFKPSSKIFYWPFQGGTSFVDLLCFCSVLCLLCLCARLFICALWSPAGKGLTSWLSFVVSTVSLSLSHWYPGSGVVLDCIDSWSLHPYLLYFRFNRRDFYICKLRNVFNQIM